jgi:hypothetical protein
VWLLFLSQPPTWRSGLGAELLNAGTYMGGLLGQSYVGVMALVSFAHPLPLWLHVPVQLLSVNAMVAQNGALCTSALMDNEVGGWLAMRWEG